MDTEDHELRAELEAACEKVRRQIDLLQRSQRSRFGGGGDVGARKALQNTLTELEEALANLGRRNA